MDTGTSKNLLQRKQKGQDDSNNIDYNLSNNVTGTSKVQIFNATQNTIPKRRQDVLKWVGWGYKDFTVGIDDKTGLFKPTSDRYAIGNCAVTQEVREWLIKALNMDLYDQEKQDSPLNQPPIPKFFPKPIINKGFVASLNEHSISNSYDGEDRYFRAHGHALDELMALRSEQPLHRIPDLIVWPSCHDDVVRIVELANLHNVVIIPFGGGTNVTRALECNPEEKRTIVSLDTSQMSRVLWVDKTNLLACCESGIIGQDLGRELEKHGLTTGHEPDSYEFSSLGGWVATRASGMKKNLYGNIEDLVVHVRFVTPSGVLEKQNQAPRISCGPDFNQIVLGSEGSLGVVTEVIIKVRPIPECREFNSLVFPNFNLGVNFMHEVARKRYQPASLRLIDNEQYQMGKIFKETAGIFGQFIDSLKMLYVTKYMGISEESMCIVIAVFEGDKEDVAEQKGRILRIAQKFEGFLGGNKNGERGYMLTFTIAYVRDICFLHDVIAESFETSVPWDRCISLCRNVKSVVMQQCKVYGITHFQVSCRVTQVYDTGACVYFYFAFNTQGVSDAVEKYGQIEVIAREEILASGGSLSHHHGVGKVRRRWFPQQVSAVGVQLYKAIKKQLDPNNVFACGNLFAEN